MEEAGLRRRLKEESDSLKTAGRGCHREWMTRAISVKRTKMTR